MQVLQIEHPVPSFEAWKQAFDRYGRNDHDVLAVISALLCRAHALCKRRVGEAGQRAATGEPSGPNDASGADRRDRLRRHRAAGGHPAALTA